MTKLSMFEWTEEFPMGSYDVSVGSFQDSEIDLSDKDAARIANWILDELKEGNHVTFRIDEEVEDD
ncbi:MULTISPECIES: hypothetical protein [Lactobacillaceae]|uniref:hypothetical protein n=1 Tax=Lactobacillaceae TaxID=33958 RepID=UPI000A2EA8BD|nr:MULTISPECIES: hypothetical protein [Lactobacillaceae]KAF0489202.1 hypothetical protein GBP18_07785 [Pediococcus acidilactici]OTA88745.1 hypothetical protein BHL84_04940 [Limosilactobacillus reuteri]RJF50927.1 hypothetical protein DSN65_05250 [Pediococcus acidilactici]